MAVDPSHIQLVQAVAIPVAAVPVTVSLEPQILAVVGGEDVPLKYQAGADLEVNLSWGFSPGSPAIDLDCSVLCFNSGGALLDAAYYNQKVACGGGISHSGDIQSGGNQNASENVKLDLDFLSTQTASIDILVFIVNAHKGGTLKDVSNAYASFHEVGSNVILARCEVGCSKRDFEGVILGLVYKTNVVDPNSHQITGSFWKLRNVSRMCSGKTFDLSLPDVQSCLNSSGLLDPTKIGMVMSMEKKFDMQKNDYLQIPHDLFQFGADLFIGLGWEADNPRGTLDLDASIVLLDAAGNKIDVVYYGNKSFMGGRILHQGDNQTGRGKGDDERIDIDIDQLPPQVHQMYIVVNCYNSWGDFSMVRDAYVRLVAAKNQHEFCRYKLEGLIPGCQCLIFCRLFRAPAPQSWLLQTIGIGCQGREATAHSVLMGCYASSQLQQIPPADLAMVRAAKISQPQRVVQSPRPNQAQSPRNSPRNAPNSPGNRRQPKSGSCCTVL